MCNKYVCGRVNCGGGSRPGEVDVSFAGTAGMGPAFDSIHRHHEEFSVDRRDRSGSTEPFSGRGGLGVGRESGDFSSRRDEQAGQAGEWANVDMGGDGRH